VRTVASIFGVNEFGSDGHFNEWKEELFQFFEILANFLNSQNMPAFQTLKYSPSPNAFAIDGGGSTFFRNVGKNS
jgi:hypothetical protein